MIELREYRGGFAPDCTSDSCPLKKECANHVSAGDLRIETGKTPILRIEVLTVGGKTQVVCDKKCLPIPLGFVHYHDGWKVIDLESFYHGSPIKYMPAPYEDTVDRSLDHLSQKQISHLRGYRNAFKS